MQKYLLEKTIIGSLGRALHISISLPSPSHHQHQRSVRSTSQNSPTLSKSSSNRQTHLQTTLHQQEIYPTLVSPQMAPCSSHVLESIKRVLSISAAHKTTPCFHNTKPAIIQMESGWPSSVMTTTFFIVWLGKVLWCHGNQQLESSLRFIPLMSLILISMVKGS